MGADPPRLGGWAEFGPEGKLGWIGDMIVIFGDPYFWQPITRVAPKMTFASPLAAVTVANGDTNVMFDWPPQLFAGCAAGRT